MVDSPVLGTDRVPGSPHMTGSPHMYSSRWINSLFDDVKPSRSGSPIMFPLKPRQVCDVTSEGSGDTGSRDPWLRSSESPLYGSSSSSSSYEVCNTDDLFSDFESTSPGSSSYYDTSDSRILPQTPVTRSLPNLYRGSHHQVVRRIRSCIGGGRGEDVTSSVAEWELYEDDTGGGTDYISDDIFRSDHEHCFDETLRPDPGAGRPDSDEEETRLFMELEAEVEASLGSSPSSSYSPSGTSSSGSESYRLPSKRRRPNGSHNLRLDDVSGSHNLVIRSLSYQQACEIENNRYFHPSLWVSKEFKLPFSVLNLHQNKVSFKL